MVVTQWLWMNNKIANQIINLFYMKKIILLAMIVLTTIFPYVQAQDRVINENTRKSLLGVTYRLFPTENMWTFIKLNTRNGLMWQVQFDVNGENRFESYLNVISLVEEQKEVDDRFTLYSTQNMWTFILLDQYDGKMWQVQWSIEPENRGIIPIE